MAAKSKVWPRGETGAGGLAFLLHAQIEGPARARKEGVLGAGRIRLISLGEVASVLCAEGNMKRDVPFFSERAPYDGVYHICLTKAFMQR